MRKAVRDQVGALVRQEAIAGEAPNGVLTITGILPEPSADPPRPLWASADGLWREGDEAAKADEVVNHLFAHTRYLLTLKGRPPFRLAGLETYERLQGVLGLSFDLLTHRLDGRLVKLYQGLKAALAPFGQTYGELQQGAVWLRDMADILSLAAECGLKANQVATHLRGYLDALYHQRDLSPLLQAFSEHLDTVSQSYWPGLFHCYDVAGLARTNNGLESHFRDTQRRLLRTTGQKGQTQRTLHRLGAWELLDRPLTEAEAADVLSRIPAEDVAKERQRLYHHRQRFRFQMRSLNGAQAQLEKLRQQWRELPKTPAG